VRLRCLIVSGLACLSLAGCGGSAQSTRLTTLTLWARSDESAFIQAVVGAYNHTHSGTRINLTIIPVNNFVQKFGIAVAGGSGPDLASIDVVLISFPTSTSSTTPIWKTAPTAVTCTRCPSAATRRSCSTTRRCSGPPG
jgi:ABC-type glycerol-3-phosphate transport system substrate-binding protein